MKRRDIRKKEGPAISTNLAHQCSFMTRNQLMKVILQIYKWRPTLYKNETLGSVAPCQYQHLTKKSPHRQHWHRDIISAEGLIVHLKLLLEFFYIEMEYSQ
jgi:hypothetical protein